MRRLFSKKPFFRCQIFQRLCFSSGFRSKSKPRIGFLITSVEVDVSLVIRIIKEIYLSILSYF